MRPALASLARNLVAGLRLALFRPLGATAFRVTLGALLALIAFDLALEVTLDALRIGRGIAFNRGALEHYTLAVSVLLATSAVLAIAFRQAHLTLALAIAVLASGPLLSILHFAFRLWGDRATGHWTPALAWAGWVVWIVLIAWTLAVLGRALAIVLAPRGGGHWLRVVAGTAVLFGTAFLVQSEFHRQDWWYPAERGERRAERPSAAAEQVLVAQPRLLADALAGVAAQRPGVTDLYFVGFGGDGTQDVFRKDVEAARSALQGRFDIETRSIALINNPDTLLTMPIATASNLRAALQAVGRTIDRDEDVVLLFLTSHGTRDHKLSVQFPPLRLDQIDATTLRNMLDASGIRWRIVVISACYAGGFIAALSDPHTVVMAAAAPDRTSFGCSTDSEMTFFTEALFKQALPVETTLTGAFAKAHALVSARELAEGLTPPSDPQLFVGDAMAAKLAALEQRSDPRPPRAAACAADAC